uniref:POF1B actin binding protein n=1 Tax=Pseudonaja textilis TaxID=8673 RepID=A0A670YCY3_PSETE
APAGEGGRASRLPNLRPAQPTGQCQPRGQPCPEPFPPQESCNGGGSLVYERVRTYSSPGGKRVQLLDAPNGCSPRALSPFDASPGYQHVIWSSDPPLQVRASRPHPTDHLPLPQPTPGNDAFAFLQEVPSPSLKLSPYSQGSMRRIILENPEKEPLSPLLRGGNNVIYEKTIRKYELLNPDEVRDYPCTQETNDQLDCRYFGELLAELHRKSNDLHSCLLQHVEKLGGRLVDFNSQNSPREDIESLIPKGLSESTKQQIRYLLEMRATADKSMKLVLATFSNLREELVHLQDDLGKLEMDKMLLEKDLSFKEAQVKEYEMMLASVRENNRQQQQALREYTLKCRSLEEQLLSLRHNDSEREFRLKDLEYSKRALEQEIQNLRLQASTNPLGQTTTDELSSRYVEMINQLREDKDREIRNLRCSLSEFQKDFSRKQGSDVDLQMKVQDLILKYRNHYPILGLLSDDYKTTSSAVGETQTIVIEKSGDSWKQVTFPGRLSPTSH